MLTVFRSQNSFDSALIEIRTDAFVGFKYPTSRTNAPILLADSFVVIPLAVFLFWRPGFDSRPMHNGHVLSCLLNKSLQLKRSTSLNSAQTTADNTFVYTRNVRLHHTSLSTLIRCVSAAHLTVTLSVQYIWSRFDARV